MTTPVDTIPSPSPFVTARQLTDKAKAALDAGQWEEAESLLLQALAKTASGSDGAYVMQWLAQTYSKQKDWKNALLWIDRALVAKPGSVWAHNKRAEILEETGQNAQALQAALTARDLSMEGASPHVYQTLARLYESLNDHFNALQNAKKFLKFAPDDPNAFYYLAKFALNAVERGKSRRRSQKLLGEAENYLQSGMALDKGSPWLLRLMGRLREMQNRHSDALFYFLEAACQMPESDYDQKNASQCLDGLIRGRDRMTGAQTAWCVLCYGAQGAGFLGHWSAWAVFGIAFFATTITQAFVMRFPAFVLLHGGGFPLRRLTPPAKVFFLDMAGRQRDEWHKSRDSFWMPLYLALVFNTPPLLLRGLWNAGLWAFHAVLRRG